LLPGCTALGWYLGVVVLDDVVRVEANVVLLTTLLHKSPDKI
jgi:hypothetical protein